MQTLEKVVGGSRAAVLRSLQGGARSVSEIVAETGLSQPNVSNHLARLREQGVVLPHREGKRIFYTVTNPDLVRALLAAPRPRRLSADELRASLEETHGAFESAVLHLNHKGAQAATDQALAAGVSWRDLYLSVFEPVLVNIGKMWEAGSISVSEEHAASQLVERSMSYIASLRLPPPPEGNPNVVVACVEGEHHQIGARMLADFLADEGMRVVFLGANVPTESLMAYLNRYKPATVAVSAALEERRDAVCQLADQLQSLRNGTAPPRLLVGGALFTGRPELVEELNAEPVPPTIPAAVAALRPEPTLS